MKAAALAQLADQIAAYEAAHGELTPERLPDFHRFCLSPATGAIAAADPEPWALGQHVTYLYRFSKYYTKYALADSPLQSIDEFVFLADLLGRPGLSKAELTDSHIHERSTGIEIITRLLRRGFIEQRPGRRDRREKELFITEAGQGVFFQLVGVMSRLAEHLHGDLTAEERGQLVGVLRRLHDYHRPLYQERQGPALVEQWQQT